MPEALKPVSFVIEVVDGEGSAVVDASFKVSVDDVDLEQRRTDQEGKIKIPKPKNKVSLSLVGKEVEEE